MDFGIANYSWYWFSMSGDIDAFLLAKALERAEHSPFDSEGIYQADMEAGESNEFFQDERDNSKE